MSHIRIWWYNNHHIPQQKYSTIEIKEAVRIGHNGVLFQPDYAGEGRGAQKEMCYFQYGLLVLFHSISNIKIMF